MLSRRSLLGRCLSALGLAAVAPVAKVAALLPDDPRATFTPSGSATVPVVNAGDWVRLAAPSEPSGCSVLLNLGYSGGDTLTFEVAGTTREPASFALMERADGRCEWVRLVPDGSDPLSASAYVGAGTLRDLRVSLTGEAPPLPEWARGAYVRFDEALAAWNADARGSGA